MRWCEPLGGILLDPVLQRLAANPPIGRDDQAEEGSNDRKGHGLIHRHLDAEAQRLRAPHVLRTPAPGAPFPGADLLGTETVSVGNAFLVVGG